MNSLNFVALAILLMGLAIIASSDKNNSTRKNLKIHPVRHIENSFCNRTESLNGLYNPGFGSDEIKCCKKTMLQDAIKLSFYDKPILSRRSQSDYSCQLEVAKDNPDDDLAISMWKVYLCTLKNAMGVSEDKIDFKSYVDFLTRNYSEINNVRNIIQKVNAECPEGDKETENYKRIEAYFFCFYTNEMKVCDEPSESSLAYRNTLFSRIWNITTEQVLANNSSCKSMPGALIPQTYCCYGKVIPKPWTDSHMSMFTFFTERERSHNASHLTPAEQCNKLITNAMRSPSTKNVTNIQERGFYLPTISCYDACEVNPVLFTNETAGPEINWNAKEALGKLYAKFTVAVQNELIKITLKRKETDSVLIRHTRNSTRLTFDEIENQYASSDDQAFKIRFYCKYYKSLREIAAAAFSQYCAPEDEFIQRLFGGVKHSYY